MATHLNLKLRHSQNRFLVFFALLHFTSLTMSDSAAKPLDSKPEGEDPEAYYIRILSSVFGSEEAAKEALVYSYKTAASGFSAKLTPDQVAEISKGYWEVRPSGPDDGLPSRLLWRERVGAPTSPASIFWSNLVFFKLFQAGHCSSIQEDQQQHITCNRGG
ncbi:hypothetical protein OROGR_021054 [Orobanche gracilis]